MEVLITGLHIALCFFLLLVVLLQPGKGADFGAAMGGTSSEVLGASGGVTLLGKLTAAAAALFMGTSLSLAWLSNAPPGTDLTPEALEASARTEAAEAAAVPTEPTETPAAGTESDGSDVEDSAGEPDAASPVDEAAAPEGEQATEPEDAAAPDSETGENPADGTEPDESSGSSTY